MLNDGSAIALKRTALTGDDETMKEQMRVVLKEVEMQTTLLHPNIVEVYGVRVDKREMTIDIFMEQLTGGSIGSMVRSLDQRLNEQTARKYVAQIADALTYLHAQRVVHRDLKCDNVLVDSGTGCVKIADFGTARTVGQSKKSLASTIVGTPYFMAPEVIAGVEDEQAGGYGVAADIWSLGILVAEMLDRGKHPWPSFTNPSMLFMHIYGPTGVPVIPEGISPEAANFIAKCTVRDVASRTSAQALRLHQWLTHAN